MSTAITNASYRVDLYVNSGPDRRLVGVRHLTTTDPREALRLAGEAATEANADYADIFDGGGRGDGFWMTVEATNR